jgi:ATP-dependent protease Clp ATPase subunit
MISNEIQHAATPHLPPPRLLTPRQLVEEASRRIVGQGRAKAVIAKAVYGFQFYAALRRNVLLLGPPHGGMTSVAGEIAKAAGLPIVFPDLGEFLSGCRNTNEMVSLLLRELNEQGLSQDQLGIICLNAGEQLAIEDGIADSRKQALQLAVGKLASGKPVNCVFGGTLKSIHTSRILFLLQVRSDRLSSILSPTAQKHSGPGGHENVVTQELNQLGFQQKLLEAFKLRAPFHALSEADLLEICYGDHILAPLQQAFAQHRVVLQFSDPALEQLADRAFALGVGAGGIPSLALTALDAVLPRVVEAGCGAQRVIVHDLTQPPEIVTGPPLIPVSTAPTGADGLPVHLKALFPKGLPPRPARPSSGATGSRWANAQDAKDWIT